MKFRIYDNANACYVTDEYLLSKKEANIKDLSITLDEIKKMQSAILNYYPMEWQPAETAPKDGSWFIAFWLYNPDEVPQFATMRYDQDHKRFLDVVNVDYTFSHWLPLSAFPPIPEEKKELNVARGYWKARNSDKVFIGYESKSDTAYPMIGEIYHDGKWEVSPNHGWDKKGQYWGKLKPDEFDIISEWTDADEAEWVKNNGAENANT